MNTERAEWLSSLLEAVEKMRKLDRDLFRARFMRRASFPEIGKELGITVKAAQRVYERLLEKLRRVVEDFTDSNR